MSGTLKIILGLLLLFTLGLSCGEQQKECATTSTQKIEPINPNGDTELALLMRAMFDEAQQIKQQIDNGEAITLKLDHTKILTAHATEPEKAASPEYQAFANTYLQTIQSFQTASPAQRIAIYDNLVANCMSCHQALCPGPIVKIKKLR